METIFIQLTEIGKRLNTIITTVTNVITTPMINLGGTNYTIIEIMLVSFFTVFVPIALIKWLL